MSSTSIRQNVEMQLAVMQYAHWTQKISAVISLGILIVSNLRWDPMNALVERIVGIFVREIAASHTN